MLAAVENHLEIDRITNSASGILSSFQNFSFHHFNFTQIPLFPASAPAPRSFSSLHPKSHFLTINQ